MRQMKLKLKYSERMMYFCHLCAAPFTIPVHQHFAESHDMHNPVENMNFVQIVMVNSGRSASGSHADQRTPTPSSTSSSQSPPPVLQSPSSSVGLSPDHVAQVFNAVPTPTDNNLLAKMEQLVHSAVNKTYDKKLSTQKHSKGDISVSQEILAQAIKPKK